MIWNFIAHFCCCFLFFNESFYQQICMTGIFSSSKSWMCLLLFLVVKVPICKIVATHFISVAEVFCGSFQCSICLHICSVLAVLTSANCFDIYSEQCPAALEDVQHLQSQGCNPFLFEEESSGCGTFSEYLFYFRNIYKLLHVYTT